MSVQCLTVGSLFAGIGGFDLAAQWMGWRTIWVSEIDPYASAVLAKHFPEAPNLGDITTIDWSVVETPDILCGGFPCQDISNNGKRAGITGSRSGLWSVYADAIRILRPRYVVVENVRALLVRGMDVVLRDLADLGYDAEWQVLSACAVGAPHLRERLWIVAYPTEERPVPVTKGVPSRRLSRESGRTSRQQWLHRLDQPFTSGDADGVPNLVDRNEALGNSIVPQCAVEGPFHRIQELETQRLTANV